MDVSPRRLIASSGSLVAVRDGNSLSDENIGMLDVPHMYPCQVKKADLLTVVHHVIGQLPYNQVPTLAKRHKVEEGKSTKTPLELLAKRVSTYDEAALRRILLEISLLDAAYMRSGASDDLLTDAAKRYRVDVEKLEKAVVAEFAAKRGKEAKPRTKPQTKSVG